MKILLYVPLSPVTPKIYGRTLQSIFRIKWDEQIEIMFGRKDIPDQRGKYTDICVKHNEARNFVLDNGYDALFLVENDMIIPEDALIKLANIDTDVAYGLYCSRHGAMSWLAFAQVDGFYGLTYSQSNNLMNDSWGKVADTEGVGMGCTLIHRHVLEQIEFRTAEKDIVADDWMFALDCKKHKYRQTHDFSVLCGHIRNDFSVVWPTIKGYELEFPKDSPTVTVTHDNPYSVNVGFQTKVLHGQKK